MAWPTGKKHTPETVERIRRGNSGKTRTPEQRERYRQAALRRWARRRAVESSVNGPEQTQTGHVHVHEF